VCRAAETGNGQAEAVANRRVERDARIGRRNFLHRAAEIDAGEVEVAHGAFVGETPAREVGWEMRAPEDDREFDEVVGEHGAANDARITVVKLGRREADARAEIGVFDTGREEPRYDRVVVTLQVTADVVAVVAEAVRVLRGTGKEKKARGLDGSAGEDDGISA